MAKSFKGKNEKVKEVKFDTMEGIFVGDKSNWTLSYNGNSKRYALKREGSTVLSHISVTACKKKAVDKGVVWR